MNTGLIFEFKLYDYIFLKSLINYLLRIYNYASVYLIFDIILLSLTQVFFCKDKKII